MSQQHQPVLFKEVLHALAVVPDGVYLDATLGRGGHSRGILQQLSTRGRLLMLDKDPHAITYAQQEFGTDPRVTIYHSSFAHAQMWIEQLDLMGKLNGILMDLGVSSPQLDNAGRGFSFNHDGPLDMRMDTSQGLDAATWLAHASAEEMMDVFKRYGEERFAKRIAQAIVRQRINQPLCTTRQLAEIVAAANPAWEKHKHPATRVFQAIRIFINRELEDLQIGLAQSLDMLAIGGRLAVISFHSLEDRIVKQFMRHQEQGQTLPAKLPIRHSEINQRLRRVGKAIKPEKAEIAHNPRARSAILRVAEKIS
ncbi:MAG: 16S rRNA (cytosine(1402)-N(4))-methyltransferase RsmH [Gammaproteobacteria bacterium]